MSSIQRLVSPKLPTTLANRTQVDLPGYDVWFIYANNVRIIPTLLDVSKFEDALSRVLQIYPHAAGQLRWIDGRRFIELTNTPVPVDIDYKLDEGSDSIVPDDWVVHDDLSSLLSQQPIGVDTINGCAPLLRLKLTFFDHETCIGYSWHHSLGDATILFRFLHTLSQFYQGLPSELPTPTFEKHRFPVPTHSIESKFSSRVPPELETGHLSECAYADLLDNVGHVKWRIDNHDLEALRSALCSNGQNGTFLSKQDCLTAYLVAVLNHHQSHPVQRVVNTISYRDIRASFISKDVASNLILKVTAQVPIDMAGIATSVRDAFIQCRQPDYIHGWVSLASKRILEAANTEKQQVPSPEGDLMINSLLRFDSRRAHFGYPDGTRCHTDRPWKDHLRLFKPNPTKGDDGVWQARPEAVEISLGVSADLKLKILDTLARGVRYMLDLERARL